MPRITEEEIEAARAMTAIEYLKRYEFIRLKKTSAKNEYELIDHDSFKINELSGKWHWKSRDIGGMSALNFLIKVDGMGFVEAVKLLSRENPCFIPKEYVEKERKPFVLPKRYENCGRVRNYLNGRGISDGVLNYCIRQGILYESSPYHNAVFVGVDEKRKGRYAFLRGIYDDKKQAFKMEQAGSEKAYAFCIPPECESIRVAVYEACIDALAHMTLEHETADKYRLTLGGISAPKEGKKQNSMKKPLALEHFLSLHPEIKEIEICTDNDFAGRWACEQIMKAYEDRYLIIKNLPHITDADYGDMAKTAFKSKQINLRPDRGR